ncbi:MAG TPA: methyltransferase domain-containing protein [Thermoanaerobaculia bacterium]|nr:methyltransferase domain-containing protein [Thermoanaerobaculia bacterium]
MEPSRVVLLCPVRGCSAPLARGERTWTCPRGHSFDRARSGYVNLLQPQDKRSKTPGDSKEAVAARHRLLEAGHDAPFLEDLKTTLQNLSLPPHPTLLDVGCGEGTHLAALASTLQAEAHGLDLSVPAIDLAARLHPGPTWIVANADRFLPYEASSFDLILSLTARMNPPELRRILSPQGRLLVAIPAEDDLAELREAVLGEKHLRNRVDRTLATFASDFELESHHPVRWEARLDAEGMRDLLAATYRGGRESQRGRVEGLDGGAVTMGRDVLVFRGKAAG